MKIVFSRKGWDSAAGGHPSPILDGCPVSLPIPGERGEPRSYGDIEICTPRRTYPLIDIVRELRPAIRDSHPVHDDPTFYPDPMDPFAPCKVAFGQTGAAQAHLDNQGVSVGDVFLFFGLFRSYDRPGSENHAPHHRIFAMMQVEEISRLGRDPDLDAWRALHLPMTHSHIHRRGGKQNNTLWLGTGRRARWAQDTLRLTALGANPSRWSIPDWLAQTGLSYHGRSDRWSKGHLDLVARGQEFVADIGEDPNHPARAWLAEITTAISA